jgi:hypothetical protein
VISDGFHTQASTGLVVVTVYSRAPVLSVPLDDVGRMAVSVGVIVRPAMPIAVILPCDTSSATSRLRKIAMLPRVTIPLGS